MVFYDVIFFPSDNNECLVLKIFVILFFLTNELDLSYLDPTAFIFFHRLVEGAFFDKQLPGETINVRSCVNNAQGPESNSCFECAFMGD